MEEDRQTPFFSAYVGESLRNSGVASGTAVSPASCISASQCDAGCPERDFFFFFSLVFDTLARISCLASPQSVPMWWSHDETGFSDEERAVGALDVASRPRQRVASECVARVLENARCTRAPARRERERERETVCRS